MSGLLNLIRLKLGASITPANNFTLDASADNGTMRLYRGNAGAPIKDLLTVSAQDVVTGGNGSVLAGNGPAFSAYQSVQQSGIAATTLTKINFQTEEFDTQAAFDTALSRFQPATAGYYQINACVATATAGPNSHVVITAYRNGLRHKDGSVSAGIGGAYQAISVLTALVFLNGTTDYVEIFASGDNNSAAWAVNNTNFGAYFQGHMVRAA